MKSYSGLAWHTVLGTHSTWVYGIVDTCAEGHRFGSSSRLCSVLLYDYETWTLNSDLKRHIDAFGNKCLCRIMGYCWYDFMLNRQLLRETDSRPINCIVCECQLQQGRLSGCMVRDNLVWRRPSGRPQLSWLVDESCQELLRIGRGPTWRLARRNPQVWHRRVGDTMLSPGICSFDWLIVRLIMVVWWCRETQDGAEVLHFSNVSTSVFYKKFL